MCLYKNLDFYEQLIEHCIALSAREDTLRQRGTRHHITIPGIHLTYADIQRRLHLFAAVATVMPTLVHTLYNFIAHTPDDDDLPWSNEEMV